MQGLYLVTPNWDDTDRLLHLSEQAMQAGHIALLQYRHKDASPAMRAEQAAALQALCRRYKVPFIINDHVDLCAQLDADGVHLGGTDAEVAAVRAQLGAGKLIGASCYGDLPRAIQAQQAGASYVAFGGFYPSRVKKYAVTTPPAILGQASAVIRVPTVVIGGMTPQNAAPLVARGANMVAAISSIYQAESVARAVVEFNTLFKQQ
ncbi:MULTISPECIES: thiamine phosphate synthase [unclassified Duganella]|uniref:thiamine phosphate synthase n=1 Tax=unclassified Duganella TaxID=2636909 RepID=UPI000886ED54|nr:MULTISPECIES: thiamine phosphate synthase [unclassified Duganella]SDG70275.1 thiamine-phosphate pyrophosphorylase [Duganella sp. OV458]SDJ95740.1 thiamine-phosphate pyrophosphorylase [Duganella sp. OV510]